MDAATRAIFIDFTVYNGNLDLFVPARCTLPSPTNVVVVVHTLHSPHSLLIEFPVGGGALPSQTFRVLNLFPYKSSLMIFVAVLEVRLLQP